MLAAGFSLSQELSLSVCIDPEQAFRWHRVAGPEPQAGRPSSGRAPGSPSAQIPGIVLTSGPGSAVPTAEPSSTGENTWLNRPKFTDLHPQPWTLLSVALWTCGP